MREFTKALGSFSVALSTFGAQQIVNMAWRPIPRDDHPASEGFEAVSRTVEGQLGGYLQQVYEAGDGVQRSAVDLAWGMLTLQALDPKKLASLSTDVLRQSAGALTSLVPRTSGTGRCGESPPSEGEPCGWGPMP